MLRYETVSVRVESAGDPEAIARAVNAETASRSGARLVHLVPIIKPSVMAEGSKTSAVLLTFEFEAPE